jgi:hypothetical protein
LTIADAITNSFSTYYNPTPSKTSCRRRAAAAIQNCNFRQPILVKFIPELKSLEPISFSGHYTRSMILLLNAAIPKLVYGSTTITNAVFKIDTKCFSLQPSCG